MTLGSDAHLLRLDTLRALAVCLVLAFHLVPEWVPWGFVGVDMFFSLSGFLMTHLYLSAVKNGKPFPVFRFIARRFWRIYPSLALTVLIALISGAFLLSPEHLTGTAWSALYALASLSNWRFFSEAGYFDTESIFKPLLHTWSLGVEEQFYVLFAIVLACARWIPVLVSFLLIAFLSLAAWGFVIVTSIGSETLTWNLPTIHNEPFSALFYLPQYRLFQFAAGALAAYVLHRSARMEAWLVPVGACALILGCLLAADAQRAHLSALPIAIGVALLMMRADILDKVARLSAIGYVAKISYQLYLVHWPLIVFWRYVTLAPLTWPEIVACLVLAFGLADMLWRLTNPMRAH